MIAIRTIPAMIKLSHASNGMRLSFMPGHRMQRMVAIMIDGRSDAAKPGDQQQQSSSSPNYARAKTRARSKARRPTSRHPVHFLRRTVRFHPES